MIDSVPLAGGALPTDHGDGDGRPSHNPSPATSASPNIPLRPDLQELVARFGGYGQITPDGWREFDDAFAGRHAADVALLRAQQAQNLTRYRTPVRRHGARPRGALQT